MYRIKLIRMHSLEDRIQILIDRAEIMSVLCSKSSVLWFQLKMVFQIPLIFTSSAMVILNSYFKDNDNVKMKLPNIIINSVNVLMMTSMNMLKIVEKAEHFKQKANDFFKLSHQIEACRSIDQMSNEKLITFQEKYMLINGCIMIC